MNLREVDFAARDEPCGSASDPGAAADSALDFADRSHFTQTGTGTMRFVDSFVSPLGTQLDHDLLFASDSSDTRDGTQAGSAEEGGGDEKVVPTVGVDTLADVLGDWADAQRALQRVSEGYDEA
ncbi:hypothetical protein TRAPUB_1356 [Trametes pubescens]|uniref:Uncharacterized protein n=1 Tax=Trametes pubescens TaxID=154538 RepID=A0A1M2VJI5_TRAPU|nr:hypothetical protein TRAPUB_1356 [Trametes pubescens]